MKPRLTIAALLALIVAGTPGPITDARPRRPPKPVEYLQFTPDHVTRRLAEMGGGYDRVTLLDHRHAEIDEKDLLCRVRCAGRRVDLVLGHPADDSIAVGIPVPIDGTLASLVVHRIFRDGREGERIDDDELRIATSDSLLVVTVPARDGWPGVDVQYAFDAETFLVAERFAVRRPWPTLDAEYRFALARALADAAAGRGAPWRLESLVSPPTWAATRNDDRARLVWTWRAEDVGPDPTDDIPDALTLSGVLPAPILAHVDPDTVEAIRRRGSLHDVREAMLRAYASVSKGSPHKKVRAPHAPPEARGDEPAAPDTNDVR